VKAPTLLVDGRIPKFKEGDRVFGSAQGSYATMIACGEDKIRPIPKGWGFFEAAGLFVTVPTSYAALVERAHVKKGVSTSGGPVLRGLDRLWMANMHKAIGFLSMRRLEALASPLYRSRRRSVLRSLRQQAASTSLILHAASVQTMLSTTGRRIGLKRSRGSLPRDEELTSCMTLLV